jgi:hypothetical protein
MFIGSPDNLKNKVSGNPILIINFLEMECGFFDMSFILTELIFLYCYRVIVGLNFRAVYHNIYNLSSKTTIFGKL